MPPEGRKLSGVIAKVRRDFAARARAEASSTDPTGTVAGKRILLVYLFPGIGDAILLAPVVKALLDAGAKPPVGLALRPIAARIFREIDLPVHIHTVEGSEKSGRDKESGPDRTKRAALSRALQAARYDAGVDLTFRRDADARDIVASSFAAETLGWLKTGEAPEDAGFDTGIVDTRANAEMHWSRSCVQPLRALGVREPSWDVTFRAKLRADRRARALFEPSPDSTSRAKILIIPGGRDPRRHLPRGFFEALGDSAHERNPSWVIVGAPWEKVEVSRLAKRLQAKAGHGSEIRARIYVGEDFATLISLVRVADVVLTNDTGPMHLAFLMRKPTLAIFGFMSPLVWGPPRPDPRAIVLTANGPEGEDQRRAQAAFTALLSISNSLRSTSEDRCRR